MLEEIALLIVDDFLGDLLVEHADENRFRRPVILLKPEDPSLDVDGLVVMETQCRFEGVLEFEVGGETILAGKPYRFLRNIDDLVVAIGNFGSFTHRVDESEELPSLLGSSFGLSSVRCSSVACPSVSWGCGWSGFGCSSVGCSSWAFSSVKPLQFHFPSRLHPRRMHTIIQ